MRSIVRALTVAAGLALAGSASAVVPGTDPFATGGNAAAGQYNTGSILGQNPTVPGWTGAWLDGFQGGSHTVVSSGLTYSNTSGTVPASGGSVQTTSDNNGRTGRLISEAVTPGTVQTFYLGFLMQAQDTSVGGQTFAALELHEGGFDDGGNRRFQLGVGEGSGNYSVRLFNSGDFFSDLGPNDNATNLFVVKFTLGDQNDQDSIIVWRNPESLSSEALSSPDYTRGNFNLNFDRTSLARFGTPGTVSFDELRFGDSWQAVTGVPEPATLSLLALSSIAMLSRRRRN